MVVVGWGRPTTWEEGLLIRVFFSGGDGIGWGCTEEECVVRVLDEFEFVGIL